MAEGRRRVGSIRLRTTVGAAAVVALALVAVAIAVVLLVRQDLASGVDAAAELRAEDVVAALEAGRSPGELVGDDDDALVQIVGGDGVVLASSRVRKKGRRGRPFFVGACRDLSR